MVRNVAVLVLFFALAPLTALAQPKAQQKLPMTPEKWQADVDYFARELPRRHKNAFHSVSRERFQVEVAKLRAKVATANWDEMFVGFMQLTALVGDGHTRVNPGALHGFAIGFADIEGAYRVVRGAGPAAELVGGRLTKIDGMPVADVVARVRTAIPQAESENLVVARTPNWFNVSELLHGLGVIQDPTNASYTAVLDDGREVTAHLKLSEGTTKPEWRLAATAQQLSRKNPDDDLWFEWLPDAKTLYVCFRGDEGIRAKSRALWSFVDAHPVEKIAFDVRMNGGGDFNLARHFLVDELARRPKLRGYAIIGPLTFSAALKATIDFRDVAHATLAGETIGERPNSYSENDEMTLPNSKLNLSYSTRWYEFQPSGGLVTPHKEIRMTWADWVAGRDPVLEWIKAQ